MENKNFKAVIFDFDDTIVDTKGFFLEHLTHTLMKLYNKIYEEILKEAEKIQQQNIPFPQIFEKLFGQNAETVLEAYREDAMSTDYKPREGMLEYIAKLHEQGVKLYILSNRTIMLPERLEQAGFNQKIFKIYQAVEPKPSKLAYTEVFTDIEDNQILIDEVIVYGNHPDDYKALPEEWKPQFVATPASIEAYDEFLNIPNFNPEAISKEFSIIH